MSDRLVVYLGASSPPPKLDMNVLNVRDLLGGGQVISRIATSKKTGQR